MLGKFKKWCMAFMLTAVMLFQCVMPAYAANALEVSAPSYILMEASTGKVITSMNANEMRSPASITKIMTLLLIFEQLETGKIKLDDRVMVSAYAKSMGGSQVYLEEGEIQTVETMIKCITVASGNDASVAMAEYIAGSESGFVELMNQKAAELGMDNTKFEDCCGLTDSDGHYTTATDVAVMSRELITKYPQIFEYSTIWMEDITHSTVKGDSQFTLSSTNKLLKQYEWITGLKTGSTDKAKYCISATGSKEGIDLIAVVMGAPDPASRFQDAATLLNYGYNVSQMYTDNNTDVLPAMPVEGGVQDEVNLVYGGPFQYLDIEGSDLSQVVKEFSLQETAQAPIEAGKAAGEAVYLLNNAIIGRVPILYAEDVEKATYKDYLYKVFHAFLF